MSGAGLTTLNTLTSPVQKFATGASGTAFNIQSSGDTHTFNIPMASTGGVTAGLLSNADYQAFSSKLGTELDAGHIYIGNASNQATAVTPGGDVSMSNAGEFAIEKLRGHTLSADPPADGQVLKFVGGGVDKWRPANIVFADIKNGLGASAFDIAGCSAGQTIKWSSLTDTFMCEDISVTTAQISDMSAVGRDLATALDTASARAAINAMEQIEPGASGEVLQSDGTKWVSAPISVSASNFGDQAPNHVLAGPASGGVGAPSFRALVEADIPNLSADKITSGQLHIDRIPTGTTAATVAVGNDPRFPSLDCDPGNKMRWFDGAWMCEPDSDTGASATSANTANAIVKRDASGNFAAGTITANLIGNVTGTASNVTGVVAVENGGTGLSAPPAAGEILIGNGSGGYTLAKLQAGSGITITNNGGILEISATSGGGGAITNCPAGWTMIGDAGKTATFCIEANERSSAGWHTAQSTCNGINDATHGRAHLCTYNEWRTACERGTGLSNMTNNWEWVADLNSYDGNLAILAGAGGCSALADGDMSNTGAFRCCLR